MKDSKFTRYRLIVITSLLLAGFMSPASAEDVMAITAADQALRIIRGVAVLKGAVGVVLQKNDMVETEAAAAQIEVDGNLIVAMAPKTKIYWVNTQFTETTSPEIVLLNGWVKVLNKKDGAGSRLFLTTPLMRVYLENGTSIAHASAEKTEVFAESGVQTVAEINELRQAGEEMKIAIEQYALRPDGQPLQIIPRPPKEFISNMPVAFRNPLTKAPDRLKGVKIPPLQERDVNYTDIQPWLTSNIAVQKSFIKRFKPRLKDAHFRNELDAELGQTVDWKPILHPPPPPPQKPKILK